MTRPWFRRLIMSEIATVSLELMSQPFLRLDGSGCVIAGNRAAAALFGMSARALAGREIARLIRPEDVTPLTGAMRKTRAAAPGSEDVRIRLPLRFEPRDRMRHFAICDVIADDPGWSLIVGEEIQAARKPQASTPASSDDLGTVSGAAILFNAAGEILDLTDRARAILELPALGRRGIWMADLLEGPLYEALRDRVVDYLDGGDWRLVGEKLAGQARRGGGEAVDIGLTVAPVGTPERPRFIAHVKDRAAEWALLDATVAHENLVANASDRGCNRSGPIEAPPDKRCLIVSKDPIVTAEAREACATMALYPITTASADTAVACFDMVRPAISLFDYRSADLDGPAAVRLLARESRFHKSCRPAVALLLPTEVSAANRAVRGAKATAVIAHPITARTLCPDLIALKGRFGHPVSGKLAASRNDRV